MEITKRKTIHDNLKKYDYLAKDLEYIEVTEWTNGEGFDIAIHSRNKDKLIILTREEIEAINHLISTLDHEYND